MLLKENKEFDIFVSSKIGSFKHIKYHSDPTKNGKKYTENLVDIRSLQKDEGITCMRWGDEEQTEVLIGRKNQQIQLYSTQHGFTKHYTADFGTGDIVGLGRCKRKLLAAVASGVVKVWSKKEETVIDTGGKLDCMRVCQEDRTYFATGGEENDLKVYQIGTLEPIFSAKNLPNDFLQLRRPVWVSGLCFVGDVNTLAVCSRHGYVRLYDTRAQRRPVSNVETQNMAATCITPSFHERAVLVGFGRGQLHQVDLRVGRLDKGFKGAAGAISSIDVIKGDGLVVSASLDRHLRVHRFDSKELVYKQYLTSKLTQLLVQTNSATPLRNPPAEAEVKRESGDESADGSGDELDDLFENMPTVGDRKKPTKAHPEDSPQPESKRIKPSAEGSTEEKNEAIAKLLRSTEKQKRKAEKKKREKRAKSVFHNA